MRQQIVNMTPHTVSIKLENGEVMSIPPSGQRAEVGNVYSHYHTSEDGVGFYTVAYGEPSALPAPQWDAEGWDFDSVYVVSSIYAAAIADQGRGDVYIPGEAIRDEAGRIIGCQGLAKIPAREKSAVEAEVEKYLALTARLSDKSMDPVQAVREAFSAYLRLNESDWTEAAALRQDAEIKNAITWREGWLLMAYGSAKLDSVEAAMRQSWPHADPEEIAEKVERAKELGYV